MSFRKRSDALPVGDDTDRPRTMPLPNRTLPNRTLPNRTLPNRTLPNRTLPNRTLPNRGGSLPVDSVARGMGNLSLNRDGNAAPGGADNSGTTGQKQQFVHPGVKPSRMVTSQQVTSTGCSGLDKTLLHGGIPINHSLLIQESGDSTDFNSVLTKLYSSQSIQYNKVQPKSTHLIVLTRNQHFSSELPGLYKSSSRKELKKLKVSENESRLTVQNLINQPDSKNTNKDLKIAWRYGLNSSQNNSGNDIEIDYSDENYIRQFDITTSMIPAPSKEDVSIISPVNVSQCLSKIRETIMKHPSKLIRILLPNFLHPALYPSSFYELSNIMNLITGLNTIVKNSKTQVVLMASISTILFKDQHPLLISLLNQFFDSVVELEPFPQEMLDYLEKCYKAQGQPNKVQHGLLNVYKIPILSETRGEMHIRKSELCFRNGKKGLDVEEWSIPVDESETSNEQQISASSSIASPSAHTSSCSSSGDHSHSHSDETQINNTKVSLEF